MPKYEYVCKTCGSQQELERSIHAEADAPTCCGSLMERVWAPTAVQFKGGGWGGKK